MVEDIKLLLDDEVEETKEEGDSSETSTDAE